MPAKPTKNHAFRKCPKCGTSNRIPLNPQPKKVRCGECKEEFRFSIRAKTKSADSKPVPEAGPVIADDRLSKAAAKKKPRPTKAAPKKTTPKAIQGSAKPASKKVAKKEFQRESVMRIPKSEFIEVSTVVMQRQETLLSVSFEEAMQITPLLGQLGKQVQFDLVKHIASHGGDVLATALSGATLVMDKGTFVAKLSKEGTKLLKAKELRFMKDAAGQRLPTLIDSAGKTVENTRLLGPLAKGTRIAANLTVAAVTVAHIISGADIAKKINKLDAKVDFLVAAHRINQLARIEGVYRQAKEILHMEQTEHTRWELHRLGRELFEVRSAWRREISHHVGGLQKTEESENWLLGFFQGLSRKGKDQKIATEVSARDAEIQLISGSIAIHLALAQAAGTLDTFLQVSLPDELAELQRVRNLIHERRSYIHEKHPELRDSVTDVCAKLDNVTGIYRSMVVSRIE
jgi:hypothetical protein